MTTTPTLAPCPFCGGAAGFERMGNRRQSCIVVCGNCGARQESADEDDHNGSSWNERTPTPGEDVVRLREDILRLAGEYADSNRKWSGHDIFKWVNLTSKVDALASLRGLIAEMLELADNWPGIAYAEDLERRARAALSPPTAE
jgi:Lar family restriction alleviation protein